MDQILPVTREYDGCIRISAHRKRDGSRRFLIDEHRASMDHYKRYFDWRASTGDLGKLMVLMEGTAGAGRLASRSRMRMLGTVRADVSV